MERSDANDPNSVRYRMRRKRFKHLEQLIKTVLRDKERATILDIGGARAYWDLLDPELRKSVDITLLNTELELDRWRYGADEIGFEEVTGDGCDMPEFGDQHFDIAHSNSVIEHVGGYKNMIRFADETRRVGRGYFVQVPYWWFPLEPHYGVPFFHWLPDLLRIKLVSSFNVGYVEKRSYRDAMSAIDWVHLVDKTLMKNMFPDGELLREPYWFMTKSIMMVRTPQ